MKSLLESYPEVVSYRFEGLKRFKARFVDEIEKVPSRIFFPQVWRGKQFPSYPALSLGPIRVAALLPAFLRAGDIIKTRSNIRVLDIGCADGHLYKYLKEVSPKCQIYYVGVDIAEQTNFQTYKTLAEVAPQPFDLIVLSEVAEHIPADIFFESYLPKIHALLGDDGTLLIGIPNPLTPTVLARDVTHCQHYPWYDMYGILRIFFDCVSPQRTHFITSARRLLTYPVKRLISFFLEVDWCEGLLFEVTGPKK